MPYLGYLLAQAVKAGQTVASALTSAASYVTRVGGSVVELSASAEALKSPSAGSASFNTNGDAITFEVPRFTILGGAGWYYFKDPVGATSTSRSAWHFGTQAPNGLQFGESTGGWTNEVVNLYAYGGLTRSAIIAPNLSGSQLNGGQWYHIAFTNYGRSDNYYNIYINGNLATMSFTNSSGATKMVTGNTDGTQNAIFIGTMYSSGLINNMQGSIANLSFYDRNITPEEIRSLMMKSYDELTASETKGLMMWFEYDGSATILTDKTGNATNGTAS